MPSGWVSVTRPWANVRVQVPAASSMPPASAAVSSVVHVPSSSSAETGATSFHGWPVHTVWWSQYSVCMSVSSRVVPSKSNVDGSGTSEPTSSSSKVWRKVR